MHANGQDQRADQSPPEMTFLLLFIVVSALVLMKQSKVSRDVIGIRVRTTQIVQGHRDL